MRSNVYLFYPLRKSYTFLLGVYDAPFTSIPDFVALVIKGMLFLIIIDIYFYLCYYVSGKHLFV